MYTKLYLSSCAMISMMVASSTPSPVAMAVYALEPRAAWGDNCKKEERKRGLGQQWYNKRTFCDEQLVRKIVLVEGNVGWIFIIQGTHTTAHTTYGYELTSFLGSPH